MALVVGSNVQRGLLPPLLQQTCSQTNYLGKEAVGYDHEEVERALVCSFTGAFISYKNLGVRNCSISTIGANYRIIYTFIEFWGKFCLEAAFER